MGERVLCRRGAFQLRKSEERPCQVSMACYTPGVTGGKRVFPVGTVADVVQAQARKLMPDGRHQLAFKEITLVRPLTGRVLLRAVHPVIPACRPHLFQLADLKQYPPGTSWPVCQQSKPVTLLLGGLDPADHGAASAPNLQKQLPKSHLQPPFVARQVEEWAATFQKYRVPKVTDKSQDLVTKFGAGISLA